MYNSYSFKVPMDVVLYYGSGIIGKLFLLMGTVFLIGLLCTASSPESTPEFVKIFGAVTAGALFTGILAILIPVFMQKQDLAKYMPGILEDAKFIRSMGCAALAFIVFSTLPILLVGFFLIDVRDCQTWRDVTETGVLLSSEKTDCLVDDKPLYHYRVQIKTPDGKEFTQEFDSVNVYKKTDPVPLEQSGSLYRVRGSQFGAGKVMSFILFGILFVDVCIFTILARGLWKVHRFIKRAEMESAEDREPFAS